MNSNDPWQDLLNVHRYFQQHPVITRVWFVDTPQHYNAFYTFLQRKTHRIVPLFPRLTYYSLAEAKSEIRKAFFARESWDEWVTWCNRTYPFPVAGVYVELSNETVIKVVDCTPEDMGRLVEEL